MVVAYHAKHAADNAVSRSIVDVLHCLGLAPKLAANTNRAGAAASSSAEFMHIIDSLEQKYQGGDRGLASIDVSRAVAGILKGHGKLDWHSSTDARMYRCLRLWRAVILYHAVECGDSAAWCTKFFALRTAAGVQKLADDAERYVTKRAGLPLLLLRPRATAASAHPRAVPPTTPAPHCYHHHPTTATTTTTTTQQTT